MNAVAAPALARLVALLRYPSSGAAPSAREACAALAADFPAAAAALEPFAAFVADCAPTKLEEVFAELFDFNPACAPEIGWHLYGEDYNRGAFLVRMRRLMRELEIPEDTELPDHLSHVLEVYARLPGPQALELAEKKLLPALAKMRPAAAENPYDAVLAAVEIVVKGGRR
ncbi:MAG: molecular chaperone TorD family protein [Elusimicrobia bacterium]|nr:molecular chaperone TorD family protein [Elusimicrobiota bacterium]